MEIAIVRALSVLLNIYSFIILVRIIVTWFPERDYHLGSLRKILAAITDPYLGIFRRLRFLRVRTVDFSPVLALVLLSAVQIVLAEWLRRGVRSLVLFPVFFAGAILNTVSLFCILLCVLIVIRVISIKMGIMGRFNAFLDQFLHPMVVRSLRVFGIKRNMSVVSQLLIFAGIVFVLFFAFRILSAWLFLR